MVFSNAFGVLGFVGLIFSHEKVDVADTGCWYRDICILVAS